MAKELIKTIYLDNAATTKVRDSAIAEMEKYNSKLYGNASSIHEMGVLAREAIEKARMVIAKSLGKNVIDREIIFTSGGTESNNLALKGIAFANKEKGNHIIVSKIEHDCVLQAAKWLEKQGFKISYLNVNEQGFVDAKELEKSITSKTILVSVIHGNNEIGTIQNIRELGKICRSKGVLFHSDACQSYMKVPIDVEADNVDLLTINAHKIYGPKGVGALYIRKGTKIDPLLNGGGHEFGIRSGTENVAGIIGFAKAVETKIDNVKIAKMRDYMISKILKIPGTTLNGPTGDKRLSNNVNISFSQIEGESIITYLDIFGICASTGSACSSKSLDPSHVMMALEDNPERAHGSVRLTLSEDTTYEEIDYTIQVLDESVAKLRDISPLNTSKENSKLENAPAKTGTKKKDKTCKECGRSECTMKK